MLARREDIELQEKYYLPKIARAIFIHPTDRHYGIGCDATDTRLVMRLRLLKRWHTQPFTVIAPSKDWIREHLEVPEKALEHLPGPVTIIAKMKNNDCVARDVHLGYNTLGVRIPNHWISSVVAKIGKPIVSSCANKRAKTLMTSLEDADPALIEAAEIVLHEGPKKGEPGLFIDFADDAPLVTE